MKWLIIGSLIIITIILFTITTNNSFELANNYPTQGGCKDVFIYGVSDEGTKGISIEINEPLTTELQTFDITTNKIQVELAQRDESIREYYCNDVSVTGVRILPAESGTVTAKRINNTVTVTLTNIIFTNKIHLPETTFKDITVGWYPG